MKLSNTKFRVGIAGFGVVGKRRRQYIDCHPQLRTVAVCDRSFGEKTVMDGEILCFSNYHQLLDEALDILFVSLPNYLAPEVTIAGLEKGLHVFCEKPPACTVDDTRRVIEAERRHPALKLKYGFNHRYHDSVIDAKKIIESGEYGRIINLRGIYGKSSIVPSLEGWRSERKLAGGGILLDQGIHMLDMITYFAGDFEEIKSFVSNEYWRHDVEDNAYALLRNKNGCVAMLHSTATQWQHRFRLEITLEEALLELTGILSGSKSYGEEKLKIVPRKDGSTVGSHNEMITSYLDDHSWKDEVNEFAEVIINNGRVVNGNSLDALKVMETVFRIYCADQKWKDTFGLKSPD